MLFNIYYINFTKVYEIKMMLSNMIITENTTESLKSNSSDSELEGKLGVKFLNLFNANISSNLKSEKSDSQKVLEKFKITMTKSTILKDVINKCETIENFTNKIKEGQLIKIDNIKLSLENEVELRSVKMLSNGILKGMTFPDIGGLDLNNMLNSIFKDYSYKIKGQTTNKKSRILIKIPLTFENEFENLYNIDDLFIGKVSIIGIYKGKTKINKLKNSFEFFQEMGEKSKIKKNEDIHNSQNIQSASVHNETNTDKINYHYIDLLSIIQILNEK